MNKFLNYRSNSVKNIHTVHVVGSKKLLDQRSFLKPEWDLIWLECLSFGRHADEHAMIYLLMRLSQGHSDHCAHILKCAEKVPSAKFH
jgi:hypothetical protein